MFLQQRACIIALYDFRYVMHIYRIVSCYMLIASGRPLESVTMLNLDSCGSKGTSPMELKLSVNTCLNSFTVYYMRSYFVWSSYPAYGDISVGDFSLYWAKRNRNRRSSAAPGMKWPLKNGSSGSLQKITTKARLSRPCTNTNTLSFTIKREVLCPTCCSQNIGVQ